MQNHLAGAIIGSLAWSLVKKRAPVVGGEAITSLLIRSQPCRIWHGLAVFYLWFSVFRFLRPQTHTPVQFFEDHMVLVSNTCPMLIEWFLTFPFPHFSASLYGAMPVWCAPNLIGQSTQRTVSHSLISHRERACGAWLMQCWRYEAIAVLRWYLAMRTRRD